MGLCTACRPREIPRIFVARAMMLSTAGNQLTCQVSVFLVCNHSLEKQKTKAWQPCWRTEQETLMRNLLLMFLQHGRRDVTRKPRIVKSAAVV